MKADNFLLFIEQWDAISLLDHEQRSNLLQAFFAHHGAECEMPEMDQATRVVFLLIRSRFDANKAKYEDKCRKNKENGSRGGRPKKDGEEKPNGFLDNPEKPNGFFQNPLDLDLDYIPPLTPPAGGSVSLLELAGEPEQDERTREQGNAMPADCPQDGTAQKPEHTPPQEEKPAKAQRSKRKVKGADLPPYTEWFEKCWKAYPRKTGKGNAWRAFLELDEEGELPADLDKRIENRALEPDWDCRSDPGRMRFVQHMSTWLHARGWEDEACLPDQGNPIEDALDERRNTIMARFNFGMPRPGESPDEVNARCAEMTKALEAEGL